MFWDRSRKNLDLDSLDDGELERYERNVIIKEWGGKAGQLKLKKSTVLVAGAGGSGSTLLYYLTAAGVGTIKVCDGDRVTRSNLNRQILYNEKSIGKVKAAEACKVLRRLNSDIVIEPHPYNLDETNVDELVKRCDLICCAVDSKEAMKLISHSAMKAKIPIVWAGGYYMGGFLTFINPPITPCLECMLTILDKWESAIREGAVPMRDGITFEVGGMNPIVGAAAGTAGAIQAMEAIKHLIGFGGSYLGVMMEFQMGGVGMQFNQFDIDQMRRKGCAICNP